MELIARLTRAQLAALNPCAKGLELFDRIAPGGEIALASEKDIANLRRKIGAVNAGWIDGVLPLGDGDGSGSGYGYGYGDGGA